MRESQSNVKKILNEMSLGPGPADLVLPESVSRRLPRKDSIRTWRKPQSGYAHRRKEERHHFVAHVLLSDGSQTVLGRAANISESAIFITTDSTHFGLDAVLDITIIPFQSDHSYQTKGKVFRNDRWPVSARGYVLLFEK